jgi:cellulose synthase/poly-beta-1,6-N-acetylglucosamine synthase-like glycosyltransferase
MIETIIATAFLIPATIAAIYYFGLTFLARFAPKTKPRPVPTTRFTILVPAHNEELSLPATLQSIRQCNYPRGMVEVVVIADNCDDGTAHIACERGVRVLERRDPIHRGKGFTLEFALKKILPTNPDVILILDADGEMEKNSLRIFDAKFAAGALAVQGSIRTRNSGDGATAFVAAVGNVLDDAIAAGRDRLGWRVPLRGSNMAFRREILEDCPWDCHGLTEDAEYSAKLKSAGIRVRFEPNAIVRSESPDQLQSMTQQRRRWRAALCGPMTWLESKPIVLAHFALTTLIVLVASTMLSRQTSMIIISWLLILYILTISVYGFAFTTIPLPVRNLIGAPRVILRLLSVSLGRRDTTWRRTPRNSES